MRERSDAPPVEAAAEPPLEADGSPAEGEDEAADTLLAESLLEDVSIDGMCGVY
jgi:mycofactocin precursor